MADKLLICISAEQASVAFSRNGRLGRCRTFRNDEQGRQIFDQFLAGIQNVPVHVMADVVEEDYRFELLPHARGRDRTELIDRRLRQLYRNTPYCAAVLQGRDSGKRRDDQYLFIALINPELIDNWITQIRSHELPVAGVHLLPVIAEPLSQKIAPATPNLLLLPGVLYFIVFRYIPMFGLVLAFKDYSPFIGIWDSPWVGLKHFRTIFSDDEVLQVLRNTLYISFLQIAFAFPIPIILALMLNEVRAGWCRPRAAR